MSLQIWLPLNGDLKNIGLLQNISVINNGAVSNNNGKIGKCYYFNNSTIVLPSYNTTRSICFWIKTLKTPSVIAMVDYKSQLAFGFNSAGNIIATCASQNQKIYTSTNFIDEEWNHIALTRDNNFSDVLLYINGVLQTDRLTNNYWTNNVDGLYFGGRSTGNNMTCYLNDIRVYNHTLSAEEVKEISKGLILHYHLSGENTVIVPPEYQQLEYLESTSERTQWINTGIVPTDNFEYRFKYALRGYVAQTYHGPFGAYSGSNYKATRLIDSNGSATTVLLYFRSKASGGYKSVKIAQTDMTDNIIEGKISKNSYYLKNLTSDEEFFSTTPFANTGEEDNTTTMKLFGSGPNPGSGTVTKSYTRIYYFDTYNNGVCIQKLIPVKRLSDNVLGLYDVITGTFLTNAGSGTFTAGPNITITGTVYDSSGYNNNGTVVQSLTAAAGSPRYGVATNFSGSNGFTYDHFVTSDSKLNECTFSVWIKRTYTDATNRYLFYGPFYVYLYSNFAIRIGWEAENEEGTHSSNGWSTGTSINIIAVNTWTHIAITFKNGSFKYYINGVQKSTSSRRMFIRGYQNISSSNKNGGVGNSFIGGISDLRFYMTALSETEIKELYDSSMVVDSNGNMTPRGVS